MSEHRDRRLLAALRPAVLLLLGMALQSAAGLVLDPYRDIAWIALGWLGNDAVTLVVVCPLLYVSLTRGRADQPRWQLARLGLLGYAVYSYAFYMLGAALNPMFPIYIALFVAAAVGLVAEFGGGRIPPAGGTLSPGTPVRLLGGYLIAVALILATVWLVMWALHVFADRPAPGSPEVFRLVAVLDLGLMVPALGVGGALLWRRRPLGVALAALAGIQAALYLLVLTVNAALGIQQGLATWPGELPVWAPLCAATGLWVLVMLRRVHNS